VKALDARGNDVENIVLELAPAAEIKENVRLEGRALPNLSDLRVPCNPMAAVTYRPEAQGKADGKLHDPQRHSHALRAE